MELDKELTLLASFALAYMVENINFTESMNVKADELIEALSPWIESSEGNDDADEQVLDELIANIKSIQAKLSAYDDLEY